MNDVGCYVAFHEVRDAILISTALVVTAIFSVARWIQTGRERRQFASPVNPIIARPACAAPFTVFYRIGSCNPQERQINPPSPEGGVFARISGAFSTAAQPNRCCPGLQTPLEGIAIVDGVRHPVVLREGVMILAIDSPVPSQPAPIGVRAYRRTECKVGHRTSFSARPSIEESVHAPACVGCGIA